MRCWSTPKSGWPASSTPRSPHRADRPAADQPAEHGQFGITGGDLIAVAAVEPHQVAGSRAGRRLARQRQHRRHRLGRSSRHHLSLPDDAEHDDGPTGGGEGNPAHYAPAERALAGSAEARPRITPRVGPLRAPRCFASGARPCRPPAGSPGLPGHRRAPPGACGLTKVAGNFQSSRSGAGQVVAKPLRWGVTSVFLLVLAGFGQAGVRRRGHP